VLIRDRLTGRTTTWVAGAPAGKKRRSESYRPVFSHDGSIIAFFTRFGPDSRSGVVDPHNRVEIYVHDRVSKLLTFLRAL
jgi:hypothetical protein